MRGTRPCAGAGAAARPARLGEEAARGVGPAGQREREASRFTKKAEGFRGFLDLAKEFLNS